MKHYISHSIQVYLVYLLLHYTINKLAVTTTQHRQWHTSSINTLQLYESHNMPQNKLIPEKRQTSNRI